MANRVEGGEKSVGSSGNMDESFRCIDCGQEFKSLQELKEHESSQH
jgi:hypothetical protein